MSMVRRFNAHWVDDSGKVYVDDIVGPVVDASDFDAEHQRRVEAEGVVALFTTKPFVGAIAFDAAEVYFARWRKENVDGIA